MARSAAVAKRVARKASRRPLPVEFRFEARVTDLTSGVHSSVGCVSDLSDAVLIVNLPPQGLKLRDRVQLEMADSVVTGRVVYYLSEPSQLLIGILPEAVEFGASPLAELLQRKLLEATVSLLGVQLLLTHPASLIPPDSSPDP